MAPRLLAALLIAEYLAMAVLYAVQGDWRRVLYWVAASVLTASVTY
ncbi:MAG: hypothetical protein HYX72_14390 [Acidobacteria bacterium]|nr:hypothetical protein [Acidobacteriota bacterium]